MKPKGRNVLECLYVYSCDPKNQEEVRSSKLQDARNQLEREEGTSKHDLCVCVRGKGWWGWQLILTARSSPNCQGSEQHLCGLFNLQCLNTDEMQPWRIQESLNYLWCFDYSSVYVWEKTARLWINVIATAVNWIPQSCRPQNKFRDIVKEKKKEEKKRKEQKHFPPSVWWKLPQTHAEFHPSTSSHFPAGIITSVSHYPAADNRFLVSLHLDAHVNAPRQKLIRMGCVSAIPCIFLQCPEKKVNYQLHV